MHIKRHDAQRLGIMITVGSALVFGLWPPAARAVYNDGGNAVTVMLANTWMRALAMGLFCFFKQRALFKTKRDTRYAMLGGLAQALAVFGLYKSTEYLPGPVAIIILFSHTLMLLFFMAWRGEVKLTLATVATTISALLGLSFVVDVWHHQEGATMIGFAWAFMAALTTVGRLYAFGNQTKERHPIVVGAENFITASVFLIPVMFFQAPVMPQSTSGWGWLALGSAASVLGTFGMFYGISLLGSFRYSLFLKLEPVFTAIFAALLINEILKPGQYVGMVLVLISLVTYQIFEHRKKAMQALASPTEA